MNKQLIILATLVCFGMAGNYLDNYFCTNEICNQYWVDCSAADQTKDVKQYCDAKNKFLACVKAINNQLDSTQRNNYYNQCRNQVNFDNANQYFYFLNCQVNCGYQSLWLNCAQQLDDIGNCPKNCNYTQDYQKWNNEYLQCTAVEDTNLCTYVSDNLVPDCQNSVKAKCKSKVSASIGQGNKYVNLMYCSSNSMVIVLSLFSLITFFLL